MASRNKPPFRIQFLSQNPHLDRVLYGLLILDVFFVLVHLASKQFGWENAGWLLTTDDGYSEIFQYLKMFGIAILLGWVARNTKSVDFVLWSMIFAYLLADDALRLHERMGGNRLGYLLDQTALFAGLDNYRVGQLIFGLLVGGTLAAAASIRVFFFSRGPTKRATKFLLALLICLGFFGVGVDAVGIFADIGGRSILEDGGELIVVSVMFWFVIKLWKCQHFRDDDDSPQLATSNLQSAG